ncbi:MAG: hypothetical protein KAX39_07260 [candidate division Zixibacteria bacterium]|nr:hypothetical protein [candidate division Zixibacteria bacterium]
MLLPLDDEDLRWLLEKWRSEAAETATRKRKLDEFMDRVKKAREPFFKKQGEYLQKKRRKDRDAFLTADERDQIWDPFRKVFRQIVDDVFRNTPNNNCVQSKE